MATGDLFKLNGLRGGSDSTSGAAADAAGAPEDDLAPPLGGTRAEAVQRLQIGLSGLAAMLLLVGLANIIQDRARVSEASAVPEAAPTVAPAEAPPPLTDPLADAGVVPDMPADAASAAAVADSAGVPGQGNGSGRPTP
ncbi:MAG: hypothetical protein ACO25F_03705 [Erythrobacter sp.]